MLVIIIVYIRFAFVRLLIFYENTLQCNCNVFSLKYLCYFLHMLAIVIVYIPLSYIIYNLNQGWSSMYSCSNGRHWANNQNVPGLMPAWDETHNIL